jgi:hypothetical protein
MRPYQNLRERALVGFLLFHGRERRTFAATGLHCPK